MRDVRQAGSQLRSLSGLRGVPIPEPSASVIVSPRTAIAPEAIAAAEEHVYLTQPNTLRQLLDDTAIAWEELLNQSPGYNADGLPRGCPGTRGT